MSKLADPNKFIMSDQGLTRRGFMGMTAGAAAGLLLPPYFAQAQEATDEFKGRELNVLTWPGHGDPYMVGPFE